jgi:Holliday junction resolvasome RuvABC DNA-binding subunit
MLGYKNAPTFTWYMDVNLDEKSNNKLVKQIQDGMAELKRLGYSEEEIKKYYEDALKDEFI